MAIQTQITGYAQECDCLHCGRPLKVAVMLDGFGHIGADCLAKHAEPEVYMGRKYKLAADTLRERAIVRGKGLDYAMRTRGWDVRNFAITLKSTPTYIDAR
jgi:hypothetical protein